MAKNIFKTMMVARTMREYYTSVAVGAGLITGAVGVYAKAAFWQHYARKKLAVFEGEEEVPLKQELVDLVQKVLDTAMIFDRHEARIDFFSINGQDVYNSGTCQQRTNSIIGIPPTYACKTLQEIKDRKLMVSNEPVDEDSEAGAKLLKSLLLSERAKKFAIAREVYHVNDNHPFVKLNLFAFGGYGIYMAGRFMNITGEITKRGSVGTRLTAWACVVFGGLTLYGLINDAYECHRDRRSDMQAAQLGKDYALGGIEYYNKSLERNMAIRALMGPDGDRFYTRGGNVVSKSLDTVVPLTERRQNLIDYFTKYVEEGEAQKTETADQENHSS